MRSIVPLVLCVAFAAVAGAQTSGSIVGTVTADGAAVQNAPVQARHKASGAAFRTISSPTGEYSLTQLPAGAYDLSVRVPGFLFNRFLDSNVVLEPGQNRRIDIALKIGNLGTIADDPFTYLAAIRAKAAPLTGPTPRTVDGRPDLSGVWFGNDDLYPEDPALLPWAAAVVKERLENDLKDHPRARCLPAGIMQMGPFFRKFVQTPGLMVILTEDDVLGFRQIFLDGRPHPKDPDPTWQGHAVGRWDGDTLVVDVIGFNEMSVIGIAPHTQQLHVTERYRRRDFGHMEVQVTADDPGSLSKPWTLNMVWDLAPDQEILEFLCGENIRNIHLEWKKTPPAP
jgi:carboxypeptidase family protein